MSALQPTEIARVREALRDALSALGYHVQSDTMGSRGELYLMGDDDLARALFEFKRTSAEAIETMYQGAWTQGLPPRFAVLPESAIAEERFELLEQMHIMPLLYRIDDDGVDFPGLDDALTAVGL